MAQTTLEKLRTDLAAKYPPRLVNALLQSYETIKENFFFGRHEPAELNGGKLCEAVVRMLEFEANGKPTPLGAKISNMGDKLRSFEKETSLNESLRFHIPRVANSIYNIRNKRGVGHVGADVNPNLADSTLVASSADWIVAEFVRLHYRCTLEEAQRIGDGLVQRRLPLVYSVGENRRVLNSTLSYANQVLLLLAGEFPNGLSEKQLLAWTEHSHASVFRRNVLRPLHKERMIEYSPGQCVVLPPGLKVVEQNYQTWSAKKGSDE